VAPARISLLCAIFAGLAALACSTQAWAAAHPAGRCSRQLRPGHGLQRFINSLRPGERGCLPPGVYAARKLTFSRPGRPGAPVTLQSTDPDHPATIQGVVWVRDEANYVTLEDLVIVGNSAVLPAAIVNGDHSVWNRVDVSNPATGGAPGGICFSLGNTHTWGWAGSTTIENSRIHDCGPTTNMNHGIYAQATTGRTVIVGNWIYDNGDRGIQLYPAAQNVLIAHNVINGNGSGVIFAGDGERGSRNIVVRDNIISNSRARWNVESSYPAGGVPGTNNLLVHNCVWASASEKYYDARGGISGPDGYAVADNVVQRPQFVDAPLGDLTLKTPSGCRGYGLTGPSPPGPRSASARRADATAAHAMK
jgi:Right handed beta helix region